MSETREPKQPNFLTRFFRETIGELRRVSWPTRREAIQLTWIVLLVMLLMGVFLHLVDLGASYLLRLAVGV